MVEAWDSDDGQGYGDDIIDVAISMTSTGIDFEQSNLHPVPGKNGIGNFTLIYYSITTKPTSCSSVETPKVSTFSCTEPGISLMYV